MVKCNYIYIHICCLNNYVEVVNNLLEYIKKSGLYDEIKEIRCGILGICDMTNPMFQDPKIIIRGTSPNIKLYESFTINMLREDAINQNENEEFNALYLHSKGITKNNICINDWVNYMCYFNITQYKKCIELLNDNDTVGVNLQYSPLHYSGNFWWVKSSYLKKLPLCTTNTYNSPEFWLTELECGKYINLYTSNVNHYHQRYLEEQYNI